MFIWAAPCDLRAQYTANFKTNTISGVTSNWTGNYLVGSNTYADVLLIQGSGVLSNGYGYLGYEARSSNNSVRVTGNNSIWNNNDALYVGYSGARNSLVISNGGQVLNKYGYMGSSSSSSNNSVLVSGTNSVWNNSSWLYIGVNGAGNSLVISNGGQVLNSLGYLRGSSNSVLVTGSDSVWSNRSDLYVAISGDGNRLTLDGGSVWARNMIVSNALLTGCGAINGNVLVDITGTVLADCGGTLNFSGTVTNNGSVIAVNSTFINFLGPVVNNGLINATNGGVKFFSTIQNNGTMLLATNSWVSAADGKWETAGNWLSGAPSILQPAVCITNATTKTVTIDATTSGSFPSTLTIKDLTISAPPATTNALLLSNAGTASPSVPLLINHLTVGSGGAIRITNSTLAVDSTGDAFGWIDGLIVGGVGAGKRLIITDGGQVLNSTGLVGGYDSGSSSNNSVLVTGADSVWSNYYLYVGFSGVGNSLVISNGGQVISSSGCVGGTDGSSDNSVLVTGTNSVWKNSFLYIGGNGAGNSLVISNSGTVINAFGYVGFSDSGSSNNSVLVTGADSVWSNYYLYVGSSGAGNSLVISNGGQVISSSGYVGNLASSSDNSVLVTGTNSVWKNSSSLYIGLSGAGNHLVISNGGQVINDSGHVGYNASSSNNSVHVVGNGTSWNMGRLYAGYSGSSNLLTIAGGSVIASPAYISYDSLASNNVIELSSGSLFVANAAGNSELVVSASGGRGELVLNGGSVTANKLIATHGANSVVTFNGGVLNSGGTFVTNSQVFAVGDGTSAATFHLLGGMHSFANSLQIRSNAFLTGCGTISGNVLVEGTVLADCGGILNFTGTVTNNGSVIAVNNTFINFLGPVVNNGLIEGTNGVVQFFSTFQNNGTILTNWPENSWASSTDGQWEDGSKWSLGAAPLIVQPEVLITNATSKTVTVSATTAGSFPSTMTIGKLTVAAPLGSTNTLFLDNAGTATPLSVRSTFVIETNGAVVVNKAAVMATNSAVDAFLVGGVGANARLVITNGAKVYTSYSQVGCNASSSNNNVLVSGGGSVWNNSTDLYVGSSGAGNSLVISNDGAVVSPNLIVGCFPDSTDNFLTLGWGNLTVTGPLGSGVLDVRRGTLGFNRGTLTADSLLLTNGASSVMVFSGGLLKSGGTFVTNGQCFVVGDGSTWATFGLLGGVHSFANDLRIRSNAFLTGCGTIHGDVVFDSGATVRADCGTTLTFTGTVTNNATIIASAGTVLNFYGPVVNNAVINAMHGGVQFFSGLVNNGTILTNANDGLTSNPTSVNTTNRSILTPVGTNGFGVALLGYPMQSLFQTNYFADNLDGAALSDASPAPEPGMQQFYAASVDDTTAGPTANVVGFRVVQPTTNLNQMTVYRSWVASIQTNAAVAPDSGPGSGCAGGFGVGSVARDGTIAVRVDGSGAPATPKMAGEGVFIFPAQVPNTIIVTNGIRNSSCVLALDWNVGNLPQIGQNANLVAKNSFGNFSYVCRWDTNLGAAFSQWIVPPTFNTRGALAHNDTARMMATFVKTASDIAAGGDALTGLAVMKYTDAGGSITLTGPTTNIFGSSSATHVTRSAQHYFSRAGYVGPAQISMNDSGAVAFAVSLEVDNSNNATNGTRAAQVTGILYQPTNSTSFLLVTDNTDTNLFWVPPVGCTNKNLISSVALDNYNNVYFMASYTNNAAYPCDLFPRNAFYQAVANDPTNPTAWQVRILLKEGDVFTNEVSGDVFRILDLPYKGSLATKSIASRSIGPNAINRTQLPGHDLSNTQPSDPFAVGGLLVQATLTNLTAGIRTDGLLYVAPYWTGVPAVGVTITLQPQSQTVLVGSNVTFSVTATGTDPLRYQWRKDSSDIGGATNALLGLGAVQVSDAGSYSVVVSNIVGAVTSTNATLTVLTPFHVWQLQYFNCTNCPPALADADPDGDGLFNLQEFLAGTDPTNSASVFRITAIAQQGNDLRVTWTTGASKTNALQAAAGGAGGSYNTNTFADIFTVTNTVGTATNYLDTGAVTNAPALYYRVLLVP